VFVFYDRIEFVKFVIQGGFVLNGEDFFHHQVVILDFGFLALVSRFLLLFDVFLYLLFCLFDLFVGIGERLQAVVQVVLRLLDFGVLLEVVLDIALVLDGVLLLLIFSADLDVFGVFLVALVHPLPHESNVSARLLLLLQSNEFQMLGPRVVVHFPLPARFVFIGFPDLRVLPLEQLVAGQLLLGLGLAFALEGGEGHIHFGGFLLRGLVELVQVDLFELFGGFHNTQDQALHCPRLFVDDFLCEVGVEQDAPV